MSGLGGSLGPGGSLVLDGEPPAAGGRYRLQLDGHPTGTSGPEPAVLDAVERWGVPGAARRLSGGFALALWDSRERTLHLVRDRLGEKPLYYAWDGEAFHFASGLRPFRRSCGGPGEVDRGALSLLLRYGYIPEPWTIYRRVRKLPPGTVLTVRAEAPGARPEPAAYWSLAEAAAAGAASPFAGSDEEAVELLQALLRAAVARQTAGTRAGAFLSGGVDSSLLAALLQELSGSPVPTFCVGFSDGRHDESPWARAVARRLGTDHSELRATPADLAAVVPRLPELYDEPFGDSSQVPTVLLAQLARQRTGVVLAGDGGDELLGYYLHYERLWRLWRRTRAVPARRVLGRIAGSRWAQGLAGGGLSTLEGALSAAHPQQLAVWVGSQWKRPADVALGGAEPPTPWTEPWDGPWDGLTERLVYLDAVTHLPGDFLTKVDRAARGAGLDVRMPFLDPAAVELAWSLPRRCKARPGQGKWALRQILRRYLPEELVDRPKRGFTVPLGPVLAGPLRAWAEALLDERRLRREGFFRPAPVRRCWREQLAGRRDWEDPLWIVLMFQAWLERE